MNYNMARIQAKINYENWLDNMAQLEDGHNRVMVLRTLYLESGQIPDEFWPDFAQFDWENNKWYGIKDGVWF
jgi:hypothetical protein